LVAQDAPLEVRGQVHPWVSRGGVKLVHALDHFRIDPADKVCLDIGASTGGFTHVLVERGARRVYAVDVGRGQLAWPLRRDERVIVLEKINCRSLSRTDVPEPVDVIVCDVSFIGLRTSLPTPLSLAAPSASLVALIKPQFEAGREYVGKGGIVRDVGVRQSVCDRIVAWLAALDDWSVLGVVESPITGADGNVEYLIAAGRGAVAEVGPSES
jgi:23S rRNA (cytidine1920-2'-O)/16S rRNA (cytidine1409-2'-O)-methyltransferase